MRFHAVFWPAFLMAAACRCPSRSSRTAGCCFRNDKMSKSRGNIVRAEPIRQVMGADALRYFLLREIVFGQDGSFSYDALVGRYNSDLANGLGNLASRTLTMIHQYRGGEYPRQGSDPEIAALADETVDAAVQRSFDAFEFSKGLEAVWALISARRQVHRARRRPGSSRKQTDQASQAALEHARSTPRPRALRIATALAAVPVLPQSAPKIWAQLGMPEPLEAVRFDTLAWGTAAARPEDRRDRRRLPAHRCRRKPSTKMRDARGDRSRPNRAALLGKKPARAAEPAGGQDHHRRFRQGRSARRPGAVRRARQGRRQAAAPEGRYRRSRSRAPSWPASPKPTRRSSCSAARW